MKEIIYTDKTTPSLHRILNLIENSIKELCNHNLGTFKSISFRSVKEIPEKYNIITWSLNAANETIPGTYTRNLLVKDVKGNVLAEATAYIEGRCLDTVDTEQAAVSVTPCSKIKYSYGFQKLLLDESIASGLNGFLSYLKTELPENLPMIEFYLLNNHHSESETSELFEVKFIDNGCRNRFFETQQFRCHVIRKYPSDFK